jgi:ligand-binding sensor domain-containing protein
MVKLSIKKNIYEIIILLIVLNFHNVSKSQYLSFSEVKIPDEIQAINSILIINNAPWLATAKGLYCYSGSTFTRYFIENQAACFAINTAITDRAENIWFGNYNGLVVKYRENKIIEKIDIKPLCSSDNYLVTSISIDTVIENNNTQVLITTSGGEIFAYDTIGKITKKIENPVKGTIYSIQYGYYPTIWLCTSDGLFTMSEKNNWKKKNGLYTVYQIVENIGKYWAIGRDNEKKAIMMMYYSDKDKKNSYRWKEFNLQKLKDKYIRFNEIAFSENEIAWIATDQGLISYNPLNAELSTYYYSDATETSTFKHIKIQNNQTIWLSSPGRKLYKIELK